MSKIVSEDGIWNLLHSWGYFPQNNFPGIGFTKNLNIGMTS